MKNDLRKRDDIELLINHFYEKVKIDPEIGFFFHQVVAVDWEAHLPHMYDFWENVLFHSGGYRGNPMQIHMALHKKHPITAAHFKRWLALFNQSVDELFTGEQAENLKTRAANIAYILQEKIITPTPGAGI